MKPIDTIRIPSNQEKIKLKPESKLNEHCCSVDATSDTSIFPKEL